MSDQPKYWTIIRNDIAYTPTAAVGIYDDEAKGQAVVEAMWAEGKEALLVPLEVERLNPIYRAGQLRTYSETMSDLADEMELVESDKQGTTIRIEHETYRTLMKNRTLA